MKADAQDFDDAPDEDLELSEPSDPTVVVHGRPYLDRHMEPVTPEETEPWGPDCAPMGWWIDLDEEAW